MGRDTKIEWADHTWNPWIGCTRVSPACNHCYAEAMMDHRMGRVRWGAGEDRKRTGTATWSEPIRINSRAAAAGRIETVFCLSLGDIWDTEVDAAWQHAAFQVMESTPHLVYLLLSKRIGNAVRMCDPEKGGRPLPRNAALGATMVNQAEWDRDIAKLKEAGARLGALFTFSSIEPMLGPIDAHGLFPDWVIVGGESGPGARPMHPDWTRSMRDQCAAAGVPFFFKQHGEWIGVPDLRRLPDGHGPGFGVYDHCHHDIDHEAVRVGKKAAGRLLDGVEHSAKPEIQTGPFQGDLLSAPAI